MKATVAVIMQAPILAMSFKADKKLMSNYKLVFWNNFPSPIWQDPKEAVLNLKNVKPDVVIVDCIFLLHDNLVSSIRQQCDALILAIDVDPQRLLPETAWSVDSCIRSIQSDSIIREIDLLLVKRQLERRRMEKNGGST